MNEKKIFAPQFIRWHQVVNVKGVEQIAIGLRLIQYKIASICFVTLKVVSIISHLVISWKILLNLKKITIAYTILATK